VPFALLLAIAELSEADRRRGLAHLQASEFLYETSLFPDLEYTFKHALTHEVAYGGLLHDRRRQLHAAVIAAIEQQHADRLGEHTERLAHHAVRAETWNKAVTYLWQAGRNARARSAYRQAIVFLEQALEILNRLPETSETAVLRIDLLCRDLGDPLTTLTQYEPLLRHLHDPNFSLSGSVIAHGSLRCWRGRSFHSASWANTIARWRSVREPSRSLRRSATLSSRSSPASSWR
jgi:hypothetical protein